MVQTHKLKTFSLKLKKNQKTAKAKKIYESSYCTWATGVLYTDSMNDLSPYLKRLH